MSKFFWAIGLITVLAVQASAYPRYYRGYPRYAPGYEDQYATRAYPETPNDLADRVEVFGTVGYSGYILGDENQYIDQLNADSALAGGKTLGHISGGISGGLGMAFGLSDFCQIGFEYEGLGAGTSGPLVPGENATISLPASEFGAFLKLAMPVEDRWLLSLGLGVYSLWIDNDTEKFTLPDGSAASNTFFGSTGASKLWAGGEYFFTRHVSLGVDAGYRFARINDVTNENGVTWYNSDGSRFTLDYSGPFARTGLHLYF